MTTSAVPQPLLARTLGAALALIALVAAMVVTASPADAHARLEGSSPQDGATLSAVPPEIALRFNEPIQEGLNQVTVKSASTDVAKGDPQVEGSTVYQPVEYTMDPGEYTVTYKVVSADGHPVSGSFSFTFAPSDAEGGAGQDPEATPFSPSENSSPADGPSTATDGETSSEAPSSTESSGAPSEAPSGSDESAAPDGQSAEESPQDETATHEDSGTSPWWWALAAGALVLVIGGLVLLVRGRRDADDEDNFFDE